MRERAFDKLEVLNKSMTLFWEKGYFDTSIQDLVNQTGVARSGLYGEFGGKHQLFLNSLDHYQEVVAGGFLQSLRQPGAGLNELRAFLNGMIELATDNESRKLGCLMCNTALELAPTDDVVASRVKGFFDIQRNTFAAAVRNAQAKNELASDLDATAQGDYLMGVIQGLLVLARAPISRSVVQRYWTTAIERYE